MNHFQMNRHYLILLDIFIISILTTSEAQDNENLNSKPENQSPSTTESLTSQNFISTSNKPSNDAIDDIFSSPQHQIFNPTPSTFYPSYTNIYKITPTSDKLFELSFKKKFFPFGGLSLDIKKYKNEQQQQQQQQQQYLKPIINTPYLMPPFSDDSTIQFISKKPNSNYFNNIFNHSFDWGGIVKLPGIAIQKFGKFGVNIFSGSNSNKIYEVNNSVGNHGNHGGLISGHTPPYDLIDEKITSKVA